MSTTDDTTTGTTGTTTGMTGMTGTMTGTAVARARFAERGAG
ncbi:hypothetical protein ACGF0J_04410 [Nonomuraea sp. NPDC047897]